MKKTIGFTLIAMSIGFISCKKNYECSCIYPGLKDADVSTLKMTEEDAKAWCNSQSIDYEALSGSCSLSVK